MEKDISRRNFFKGLGIVAAGTAVAGLAACGSEPIRNNQAVGLPETWDYETDVIVVGYGGAGAMTAINAADAGAQVIMLEKYPADTDTEVRHTPSSRMTGAQVVVVDDPKKGSTIMEALSHGATPKDVCDAWGEGAYTAEEYLRGLGIQYGEAQWDTCEYKTYPANETIGSIRLEGGGPEFFQGLQRNINDRADKITVMFETPGYRLIQNRETMEICGVVAKQGDKDINVKARKGVALCTGGFEYDEEYKLNFLRSYPSWFYANPNNTGEGIRMGQAVGAAIWHMNTMSARSIPYHPDWGKGTNVNTDVPFIFVNKYGKRWFFEAEWSNHNAWVDFVNFDGREAKYLANPSWAIYDEGTRKPLLRVYPKGRLGESEEEQLWGPEGMEDIDVAVEKGWVLKADTPEELAAQIVKDPENEGLMTPENLAATIARWNELCAMGHDEDFQREEDTMAPFTTPPFYAVKCYPGGPNTQGGLKKNALGQVLDPFGEVIKRLYCIGENGSVYGLLYPRGGGNISELTIWGRISGAQLAAETPWDAEA
jgi:succinate dehydrogenase/fumarate reductase flavoprotein subunit